MNPLIAICLFTYNRFDYARRTVAAIRHHFKYDNYAYFIGDAGSDPDELARFMGLFDDLEERVMYSHSGPYGAGQNWNMAINAALEKTDFFVRLEDDWELLADFDPTAHVEILQQDADIGLIRWGNLPIELSLETQGRHGHMFLQVLPTRNYFYSGNPHLTHRRFWDYYGQYPEGLEPGWTEVGYDEIVRSKAMPDYEHLRPYPKILLTPTAWGNGLFGHIGTVKSF